jgi:uncharacterized membrane protein YczE
MIAGHVGLAPWDVLHQGLGRHTGLGIGAWIQIVGVVVLLIAWLGLAQRPGIGTILNAVEIGLVVDLVAGRLPHAGSVPARIAYVAIGILTVGVGSGLYIGSGLGAGPRDSLMMGLHQKGLSLRAARTAVEVSVFLLGLVLGGSIGVGTALFVLTIGPVVHVFIPRLTMPGVTLASAR